MFRSISEPDWKLFRRLQPIALDRFCQRVLDEIASVASDADKTSHERFLAVFRLIKQRDGELADAFDVNLIGSSPVVAPNERLLGYEQVVGFHHPAGYGLHFRLSSLALEGRTIPCHTYPG